MKGDFTMRDRGLFLLFSFVLAVLMTPLAEAQLSQEYADWEEGPVGFLLTKKERKQWSKIKNDADAKKFVELFWAKRNPEPNSPFNAFKADFERRVRYADENFTYRKRSGATSDRGKTLILLGPPRAVQQRLPTDSVAPGTTAGQATDAVTGTIEVWIYDPMSMPDGFSTTGSTFILSFYEVKTATNEFVLDRSNRESFNGVRILADAPEAYLLHPEMVEVPKPVSVAGGRSPVSAHLAWIGAETEWNDAAVVIAEAGVTDATSRPLWVHIELPPDAPTLDTLAGQVRSPEGEVLSTFEIDAAPIAGQFGNAYHISFPLAPGAYSVDVAGAAAGAPVVSQSIETDLAAIPETGTWLSPLWTGISTQPEKESSLGDPYSFGGWHLVPISGPELTRENEVAYFGFLVRPGSDEEGGMKLKAQIRVTRDGKPFGRALNMPLEASQIVGDLYMYGNSIRLSGLPEPGQYGLKFKITDGVADVSVEHEIALDVSD
jgi:GWxTD domain-containing protein